VLVGSIGLGKLITTGGDEVERERDGVVSC
jgi:hypothetical protein